ncbi:hypothetical protein TNCV_3320531 [Trichonephila clavipes]|nr:hypothetical protein TNCV_3320531 [Trichonephila clavipes]
MATSSSSFIPTPLAHASNQGEGYPRGRRYRVQLKMSRQPTLKNHTTALSTDIKANHPRLRDGCSGQRVKYNKHIHFPIVKWVYK